MMKEGIVTDTPVLPRLILIGPAMQITRRFTREGQDPFAAIEFAPRIQRSQPD